ncbi:MAG: GGDEF domain-containing protein [Deltaproteobacteria bacterium]|nr:GGDEF domain-containing protein [Deltaproteobacteria bacterium]
MTSEQSIEEIQLLIQQQINLPSPPTIAVQILNTVQSKEFSLNDLEKIISTDPALSGKMLKIANSAFYSLPSRVSSITRAMSILGTNVIKNIALSFVISKDLGTSATSYFDFDSFWRRSVTTAVAAELVKNLTARQDADIFVTALLQDLGILIMSLSKGREYNELLSKCKSSDPKSLITLEQQAYKFDHQQVTHTLINSWKLPSSITEPIRYHHEPEKAPRKYRQAAEILSVADLLSTIYYGTETSENVLLLQKRMGQLLAMNKQQTNELLDDVAKKSIDILDIFDLDPSQIKPYSQMLQEANDELGRLNLSYEQLVLALKESKMKSEKFANDLRSANKQLEKLAFRDGLTNLYNHRYFQEIFDKEIKRSQRYKNDLSLIIFDIDYFKTINDTYGHPVGDQVLATLAKKIASVIRPSDTIARYGGEEFAVILPNTKEPGLRVFSERIRRCVMGITITINHKKIKVTISSGGVHLPCDHGIITKQDLIDTADRALYMSKKNGRNKVTILPLPGKTEKPISGGVA